ncbi:MAG: hypothetical protein IKJ36_03520 [Clostridia bacterium]|nr:hypothetical protein [Clostridia bacterium]
MENASKALLIAGAILISILIIAIGMFIYNSAQSTINNSMQSMSTQEVQAFNNEFMSFEGKQSGSNIKAMIGTLIANANTYRDEPSKIPVLYFDQVDVGSSLNNVKAVVTKAAEPGDYIKQLNLIRNKVEPKHQYWVSISNQDNGLIDALIVTYEADKKGGDIIANFSNGRTATK